MHELSYIQSVVETVLSAAESNGAEQVLSVTLRVGVLRDFVDEMAQQYFSYCTAGTIAHRAQLKVLRIPLSVMCRECKHSYKSTKADLIGAESVTCKSCGSANVQAIGGDEFTIEDIGII